MSYVTRYPDFHLLTESATTSLSMDDFLDLFDRHCTQYSPSNTQMYRGIETFTLFYAHVDPKRQARQATGFSPFPSLFIDNSPRWESYPSRRHSVIGATSKSIARHFATRDGLFLVIPFDDAPIAIAPLDDFWSAFDDDYSLDEIGVAIEAIYDRVFGRDRSRRAFGFATTWENIRTALDDLDDRRDDLEAVRGRYPWLDAYLRSGDGSLRPFLDEMLDPVRAGFMVGQYSTDWKAPRGREVWTDGECLLANVEAEQMIRQRRR